MVGTKGKVNCLNTTTDKPDTSIFYNVRKTRENAPVYEITTESGKKIKATSEHLILTTSGWKMVKELQYEDEIIKVM
ncbi:hypothetical protein FH163_09870 [Staphylococcus lugdunensis]|nr:hypothetical protein [Staphylococcus lugdunensis]MCI2794436.1 hypothetical protein [Staphylococcus lugdunensis]MCI2797346.1 hypothetical protein [Staphylococcus lugdunensis]